jgi:hypothetical protein
VFPRPGGLQARAVPWPSPVVPTRKAAGRWRIVNPTGAGLVAGCRSRVRRDRNCLSPLSPRPRAVTAEECERKERRRPSLSGQRRPPQRTTEHDRPVSGLMGGRSSRRTVFPHAWCSDVVIRLDPITVAEAAPESLAVWRLTGLPVSAFPSRVPGSRKTTCQGFGEDTPGMSAMGSYARR